MTSKRAMALRGKKPQKQTNQPTPQVCFFSGTFMKMKHFLLFQGDNHILKRERQSFWVSESLLPQKCSACIQSTKLNCSCHSAGPPGTALVQGTSSKREPMDDLSCWHGLQRPKGAENPKSHLHFQLPSVNLPLLSPCCPGRNSGCLWTCVSVFWSRGLLFYSFKKTNSKHTWTISLIKYSLGSSAPTDVYSIAIFWSQD